MSLALPAWAAMSDTDFHKLCRKGSPEDITAALKDGANVNARNRREETPLMTAAAYNTLEAVQTLINAGANVKAEGENGQTALLAAATSRKSPQIVQALLKAGARVNEAAKGGVTPLMGAASNNKFPEIAKSLIDAGAKVNATTDTGLTPLMLAAKSNSHEDIMALLIAAGAKVNAKDDDGRTALMFAARNRRVTPEMLELLIKSGANLNAKAPNGATAFSIAAEYGNLTAFRALAAAGGDIKSIPAEKINDLFERSVSEGDADLVRLLAKNGANVNVADRRGRTALMTAVLKDRAAVIDALIAAGADIHAQDESGKSAIMHAVNTSKPDLAIISTLLKAGANANSADKYGQTLLIQAVRYNAPDIVKLLLAHKADPHAANARGQNALLFALNNSPASIPLLVQAGVDIKATDKHGWTYLHRALRDNLPAGIIQALIDAGANVNEATPDGTWHPLALAIQFSEKPNVLETLIKAGANVNYKDKDGATPAFFIFNKRDPSEPLKKLIAAGLDTNVANTREGRTLLMGAASNPDRNSLEVTKLLLQAKANPNAARIRDQRTALMIAAQNSNTLPEVIAALVEGGANPNAVDKNGITALMIAAEHESKHDLIQALVKAGANINAKDSNERTALFRAVNQGKYGVKAALSLIENGADVNIPSRYGETPLMVARGDCPEVIAALCKAGADVNARSRDQRTPLLMLLRRSKATAAAVEAMIKGGADVNAADKSGETPLLAAAFSSDADVLSLLLRHGANVNAKGGRNERTPLMEICLSRNASTEALDVLAKAGADVNAVDRSGDSALMQAVSSYRPNPEIIDWLIAHGANARAVNSRKLSIVEAARKNKRLANTEVLQRIEAAAR